MIVLKSLWRKIFAQPHNETAKPSAQNILEQNIAEKGTTTQSIIRQNKTIQDISGHQAAQSLVPGSVQIGGTTIARYFHNHSDFQCFTSWFSHWGGHISAGHCVTEAQGHIPDFAKGNNISWPQGLDAALIGCTLPPRKPAAPKLGQKVIIYGYPAGSRHLESRDGVIYYEREAGRWICHITDPDEPVVTGMSGGPVLDAQSLIPIGITITRNSPADLNRDRDPDESADFIALSAVWEALQGSKTA